MTPSCLFCKIIAGEIKSERVFENGDFICIRDLHPQAKTHLLVIPKVHVASLDEAFPEVGPGQTEWVGQALAVATQVARLTGLLPGGFRTVINTGADGGQTVFHLHVHVLGGVKLKDGFA